MNRKNYITPRLYTNEATLFLNPQKNQKISKANKNKKPKFIFSLFIVITIFSSIIGYSAYASDNNSSWEINRSKDGEVIFISKEGKITKEDRLTYIMLPEDCNDLLLTFAVSSNTKDLAQDDMKFKVNITEEPYYEYQQSVDVVTKKVSENKHKTKLAFPHIFNFQDHISKVNAVKEIEIKFIPAADNEHVTSPEDIFNILTNRWDLGDVATKLREGQHLCNAINLSYDEV